MACYYPDETLGDGLFPCDPTAPVSHCCRTGDVCLTNGYCFSAGLNALVRRGCTDKTFNSTECPKHCIEGANARSADTVIIPCDAYGTFCCGQDDAARQCCTNKNGTVRIVAGVAMQAAPATMTVSRTISVATALITTTFTQTPTTVASSSSSQYETQKKITIGVAAGLGAALILSVAFLGWKWYKAKELADRYEAEDLALNTRTSVK